MNKRNPQATFRTNAVIWGILANVIYFACYYVIGRFTTLILVNALLIGINSLVAITWFPAVAKAIKNGGRSSADKILISLWGVFTWIDIQRLYALVNEMLGQPAWIRSTPIAGWIAMNILVLGTFAAYATVTDSELRVPIREKRFIFIGTLISGIIIGLVLAWSMFLASQRGA